LVSVGVLLAVIASAPLSSLFVARPAVVSAPVSSAGFSLLVSDTDGPATWGCVSSIPVGLNTGSLSTADAALLRNDLLAVFDAIAAVSSFRFVLAGATDAVPDARWGKEWSFRAPGMPVVVAVVPESASDLAIDYAAATGGGFLRREGGSLRISSGFVLLHAEHFDDYRSGSGFMSHHALLLHELLHVLNVGHNDASSSIMTPSLVDSYGTLGSEDVAALDLLSKAAC
jgi:hypothetical protein